MARTFIFDNRNLVAKEIVDQEVMKWLIDNEYAVYKATYWFGEECRYYTRPSNG